MGDIVVKKVEYKGWKNCVELSNGIIDIVVTTDVGPRIIRFGFVGDENEFCEVEEQIGTLGGDEWKIYGGHRLWLSPEVQSRTYYPDNSKVEWMEKENGIVVYPIVEEPVMVKKEMEITISPDEARATILHRIINKGLWDIKLSAWALSVMKAGGKEIIPQTQWESGFLPNRMISLWPYTKLNDPRVYWGEKYIMLQQDRKCAGPFKLGLPNEDGWAAYVNDGHMFVKQYPHIKGEEYPDYASSYETYTNDFMLEMETLSPLVTLEPEKSVEHTEVWSLYKDVGTISSEKDIEEAIIPKINNIF